MAADTVKWTLHKSCYMDLDDEHTVPENYLSPNNYVKKNDELANAINETVHIVKAWADRGAKKIDDSISFNPLIGQATKDALKPLIGRGNYKDNAKDIRDKFKKLATLEGPIGKDGDARGRYEQSNAWKSLQENNDHYLDFVIVCRPELTIRKGDFNPLGAPYDMVRLTQLYKGADLEVMILQEKDPGKWDELAQRLQAVTTRDRDLSEVRLHVAETITFHPLWIKTQMDKGFEGWTQEIFDQATAANAAEILKEKSKKNQQDLRPVDILLDASFARNMFHEMFHLTAFGRMSDDIAGAYWWANNIELQNRENPDLLAIIAVVIELLNREGSQYKISADGTVSQR
ncbi:uncharacterized protein DNG_05819 [Cephalotrichum gorgonifer]|uniref:Uncharacterized protein n=1 Tax=Cephalotrichum gorgonifer TaxID=2041049 RepID=A0AAE8SWL7_9PEZI|nr:uncharacterized protein DNG_05819 [Cephalotrichum gorgonifer]